MGNKSSRARSATAGPRTAQPPPPPSAQPVHRPLIQTPQQQARNSTAGMVVAAVTATASHRPRSATAGAAAATPAVPEIIVYSEASFAKFPASHRPSGRVYPLKSCRWPPDTLATMVTAKLIAPFATGFDDPASPTGQQLEECPLCMLYYSTGLNNCVTCHQGMCSECFATLLDAPAQKPSAAGSKCPFCNVAPFKHLYTGPKSIEELRKIRDEADEMSRLEKAQLDAAVAEEHARLERKKQGLPPLSPPAQPAPQNAESPPPPLPASTSPVSHTQQAVPPPRSPDDDLFDLPSEIRHAIVTEEFRQRLITYYRHKRPDGIAHVDEIVKRYGSDRQDSVIAAAVAKYGDEPSLEEMRQDVVLRLVAYYKSKKGSISPSDASAMVANFGNAPWKAMARAVVERGRETHPPPVPKPKSETNNTNSVSAAPPVPLQAAAEETTPPAATPPRAVEPPRPVTSPTTASPVSTAEAVMARLPTETRRQTILTLLRLRRPSLVPRVMELFTAMPHTRLTDTHVDTVAVECGVPSGVESVQDAAREDITLRLKHYFSAVMPQRPLTEADTLLEKYQGREPVLFAGVVIKYGPEPPGAPLTLGAVPLLNRSDDAIVGALLTSMLTTDDLDPELAIALRCSVESL